MAHDLIRLREYEASPVHLHGGDLEYLLTLVRGSESDDRRLFESITPTGESSTYRIRPGPFVGRIGLPSGRAIDIQSRFALEDVLELIRRSGVLPVRADLLRVPTAATPFLVDIIAAAFVREVESLLTFGLAKGYHKRTFLEPPYPGVPDMNLQLRRFAGRPDKLVTRAKRITRDVEVNRVLAWTLGVLTRVEIPLDVRKGLRRVVPAFAGVTNSPMVVSEISRIRLDRLTTRYRDALALAELILRGMTLGPSGIESVGASIAFNMTKVWEKHVARWVRSVWPDHEVVTEFGFDVTRGGAIRGSADVLVRRDGQHVALYDAKYKHLRDKPSSADIYQMVTYCTRLGLRDATLVYPAPVPAQTLVVDEVSIHTIGLTTRLSAVEIAS